MRVPAVVRHTARTIQRRPMFSTFLVGTLTLGIAGATVMFSILDGVLLRALPYPEPQRLVTLWQTFPHWRSDPTLADFWDRVAFSWDDYQTVRTQALSLESVAAYYTVATPVFRPSARPEQVVVAKASPSLLPLLGVQPVLGRWLSTEEEGASAPRLALLSYDEWMQRWGGERDVLGRTLRIGAQPYEIIGVLPRGINLPALHARGERTPPAVWIPIGTTSNDLVAYSQNYEVIARLAIGATPATAADQIFAALVGKRGPDRFGTRVLPRLEAESGSTRPMLLLLAAAVGLLLLLSLANVAALLLGESAGRELELATRTAIGATPGRIVRDVMLETATLALLAAVLAIVLAQLGTRALLALAPTTLPHTERIGLDLRVLAFAIGIAVISAIGIGVAPALAARRTALWFFGMAGRVTRAPRYEYALLAAQVTISTVLLSAAALLGRSLAAQVKFEPGFQTEDVMAVRVRAGSKPDEAAHVNALSEQLRQLRALPGVLDATVTTALPYREPGNTWSIEPDASRKLSITSPSAIRITVAPRFFETMNIPIVQGRSIGDAENRQETAGLVVNEAFVRRFSEGRPLIGQMIRTPAGVFPVIGIARDTRPVGLEVAPEATFYLPFAASTSTRLTFLIRARPDALPAARTLHDALAALDPELAVIETKTMPELLHESLADERYRTMLLGIFAAMATLIAAVGLAGTTMRALERRRKELCVRLSVGATPVRAARTLVSRAALAVSAGVVLGALVALPAGRVMQAYLHGINPTDPFAIALGSIALIAAAGAALGVPLRRLWRTDIAKVLRDV